MAKHVIDAAIYLEPAKLIVVVGHEAEQVRTALAADGIRFVEQLEMLGTGDAVKRCRQELSGCHEVMVLNGDCPLVGPELLRELVEARGTAPLAFVTALVADAGRLGRLRRDAEGHPQRIVEAADWRGEDGPAEINAGQYVFDAEWLWSHVDQIPISPKGEHYLTDLIQAASGERRPGATVLGAEEDVLGVDDRIRLAEAERIMRGRILERHRLAGVTISDPSTTYIDAGVRLAQDVTILPNYYLTAIPSARQCTVGPGTRATPHRRGDVSAVVGHRGLGHRGPGEGGPVRARAGRVGHRRRV
jgi:bifunctional UDP-N-acetylglucosamine pyrophosphorylase/glucosamine-1-phosphate N-acetyltransferase